MNIRPVAFVDRSMLAAGLFWKFQKRFIAIGNKIKAIQLREEGSDLEIVEEWKAAKAILRRLDQAIAPLCQGRPGRIVNARIERLDPGGVIPWTTEDEELPSIRIRLRLGVTSAPGGLVFSGIDSRMIPENELCFVNHRVLNSAINVGDFPMIHLVMDASEWNT